MRSLITDREMLHVDRQKNLATKGWQRMTSEEQAEWLGNPLTTPGANLIPYGPYYSSTVELKYSSDAIVATTNTSGIYLFAISIIGDASNYEGKTYTFSVDQVGTIDGGTPQILLYWHDDNGFEFAGAGLSSAGSVTFQISDNVGARAYLAMYVYVTTDVPVDAGASVRFGGVMLENGSVRHEYVPYTEVMATQATKGAYNYSDLNRVERAVAKISATAGLFLNTKTDWRMWDIPTESDMERYLYNINQIRSICFDVDTLPTLPSTMSGLTYTVANDIEKILLSGYATVNGWYRSGELFWGEV